MQARVHASEEYRGSPTQPQPKSGRRYVQCTGGTGKKQRGKKATIVYLANDTPIFGSKHSVNLSLFVFVSDTHISAGLLSIFSPLGYQVGVPSTIPRHSRANNRRRLAAHSLAPTLVLSSQRYSSSTPHDGILSSVVCFIGTATAVVHLMGPNAPRSQQNSSVSAGGSR